jgi:2-succinyl-5-enolpyruvyl-6-hydroxy-3-cyclohexene-1-carboxylate synthase
VERAPRRPRPRTGRPERDLPEHERLFTTPHGLDLAKLAAASGVGHERVDRATDLVLAIERAAASGGVRLVEVAIDRELNIVRHQDVNERVASALQAL